MDLIEINELLIRAYRGAMCRVIDETWEHSMQPVQILGQHDPIAWSQGYASRVVVYEVIIDRDLVSRCEGPSYSRSAVLDASLQSREFLYIDSDNQAYMRFSIRNDSYIWPQLREELNQQDNIEFYEAVEDVLTSKWFKLKYN